MFSIILPPDMVFLGISVFAHIVFLVFAFLRCFRDCGRRCRSGNNLVTAPSQRSICSCFIVIDKLEELIAPTLPHDLAGERGIIVRRAVDRFAGADAGHVVGVLHGLAVDWREWMRRPRLSYAIFYILSRL